ncbi:MAG: 3-phosphoshikimate 1-carboxyvinyltransferase [Endomicrobiaceae bacterium]|nr:3-phosphoshikimate 1-carboxyvinyltransferase [Endomicrobiaceae bacterium]
MKIDQVNKLEGTIIVPSDKSITHRAIMLSSLAQGTSYIYNYLNSADCMSTMNAFKSMNVDIIKEDKKLIINGVGLYGLKKPKQNIDAGNSGTTTRLLSGILAGQNFSSNIIGDESLSLRPMKRIIEPLKQMGVNILAKNDNYLPLAINPTGNLKSIDYTSKVASAQVKSCVLFAGLYAEGITKFTEPEKSRDHTERMLKAYGANVVENGLTVSVSKCDKLIAQNIKVPSDISSAAFFMVAGLIVKNSKIIIKEVNINKTRSGIIKVLKDMGANIKIGSITFISGEEVADIEVSSSDLHATTIDSKIMPTLIDEIPIIALCATQADGTTIISGAKELRVKESDRLKVIASQLLKMGADINETEDGLIIKGKTKLSGNIVDSFKDHRIAMMLSIAGLIADGQTTIVDSDCVNISFANFYEVLKNICK